MKEAEGQTFRLSGGTIIPDGSGRRMEQGVLDVAEGRIVAVGTADEMTQVENGCPHIQLPTDCYVLPGFLDVHIHGANGADVMDATPDALAELVRTLPGEGTTAFLATTITQSRDSISAAIANIAAFLAADVQKRPTGAEVLGIHLEGPFLNPHYAGAQPTKHLLPPDIRQFDEWQALAGGAIRLVTLAPEQPGGTELVRHLQENGVIASLGHSGASAEQVRTAVANGLRHATHLYNAMKPMHHREAGAVGAILLEDRITAELIFDAVHVCPEMVQVAMRMKGTERLVMITDSMRAKCLKNGTYELGGQQVTVRGEEARLPDGTLAGSVLKMNRAAAHLRRLAGCELPEIVRMTSENAAKELGVFDRKGSLVAGKDADLVVVDREFRVLYTFCRGVLSYRAHDLPAEAD